MDTPTPELQTMPLGLHDLVQLALLGAGFALFAYFVHAWNSKDEVSVRYRPSALAGLCLAGVATLAYFILYQDWDTGFRLEGEVYVPNEEARTSEATRYIGYLGASGTRRSCCSAASGSTRWCTPSRLSPT
jgi:hypothetical protein